MESQAQLSQQPRSQTPSLQNFNIPRRDGTWAPAYVSTEQHLHGVEGTPMAMTSPVETNGIAEAAEDVGSRGGRLQY